MTKIINKQEETKSSKKKERNRCDSALSYIVTVIITGPSQSKTVIWKLISGMFARMEISPKLSSVQSKPAVG